MWWSWTLAAVGIFGLWLAGRKDYRGWFVGLGAQILWISYALVTKQYGFIASALAYSWIYAKNGRAWLREHESVFPDGSDSGRREQMKEASDGDR